MRLEGRRSRGGGSQVSHSFYQAGGKAVFAKVENGKVRFQQLWHLFKLGDVVFLNFEALKIQDAMKPDDRASSCKPPPPPHADSTTAESPARRKAAMAARLSLLFTPMSEPPVPQMANTAPSSKSPQRCLCTAGALVVTTMAVMNRLVRNIGRSDSRCIKSN